MALCNRVIGITISIKGIFTLVIIQTQQVVG
jgi:hypothetical protein